MRLLPLALLLAACQPVDPLGCVAGSSAEGTYDADADGGADALLRHHWNAERALDEVTSDHDQDGVVDYRTSWSWDGDLPTGSRVDHDGDGTAEFTTRTLYNADGAWVRYEEDRDADGTPDRVDTRILDAAGRPERTLEDHDADGTPDRILLHHLDASGRVVQTDEDRDADGIVDVVHTTTWDRDGRWLTQTRDDAPLGSVDHHQTALWGTSDQRVELDIDGDGLLDEVRTRTWDDDGHPLAHTVDRGADGLVDRTENLAWTLGRQTGWSLDRDGDGLPDERWQLGAVVCD